MKSRLALWSVRTKLVVVIGALLAIISIFLLAFFPAHMQSIARTWAERRARDVAIVIADSVAMGVEFEIVERVEETLGGLRSAGDTVYAVLLRSDLTVFAGWNRDRAMRLDKLVDAPRLSYRDQIIDVAVPVKGKRGIHGVLVVGFSIDELIEEAQGNRLTVLAVSALVFSLGMAITFVLGTLGTRSLVSLREATERIVAVGDLSQKIGVKSRDEIGQLAATFTQMVDRLREVPLRMQESAERLTETVQRLSASTTEQAQAISQQAAALQETQVTAEEIRQTSLIAAQKAQGILQIAEHAEEVGRSGERSLEQSRLGLSEIRSLVNDIGQKIHQLDDRTHQIGTITETVKNLADQSNMLALNAAIEAVRSGEHGRAFSVVAREIRALADQSIQSTRRVREILDDISGAIRQAVAITERGAERMEAGLLQVQASGNNLRELSGIVTESSSAVRQIATAVTQQNADVGQIFAAITDLAAMMDETLRGLADTNQSVGTLKEVTEQVASVVKSFRV
jgi:methyl-accepting chemotaxis protein